MTKYVLFGPGCTFGPFDEVSTRKMLHSLGCGEPHDGLLGEYIDSDRDKVYVYDARDKDKQMKIRQTKNRAKLDKFLKEWKELEASDLKGMAYEAS